MVTFSRFNVLNHLGSEADMAVYLKVTLTEEGMEGYLDAVADVVKARAILQISKETGIGYRDLVKTFPQGIEPSSDTIKRINEAMLAPLPS